MTSDAVKRAQLREVQRLRHLVAAQRDIVARLERERDELRVRVAELESENDGLRAAAESAYADNITLLEG